MTSLLLHFYSKKWDSKSHLLLGWFQRAHIAEGLSIQLIFGLCSALVEFFQAFQIKLRSNGLRERKEKGAD